MKPATLPLGIDIGATRIRVAQAHATAHGAQLTAVAVRDLCAGAASSGSLAEPEYVAAVLEDAVSELGTRERRCIASVGEPDALLRAMSFPKMSALERERCGRYEARRHVDFPPAEATVQIHPLDPANAVWALGIARSAVLESRIAALRAAKLKPAAIDHEACALLRALPEFDAVIDVGYQRASMHVRTKQTPQTLQTFTGGCDVTRAIERDLSVDEHTAEKRKRILGTAGAGEGARSALVADIAGCVGSLCKAHEIERIALTGNGARLPGFPAELEAATGLPCELAVGQALRSDRYPEDVVRSSAPDWTLAAGLALWRSSS